MDYIYSWLWTNEEPKKEVKETINKEETSNKPNAKHIMTYYDVIKELKKVFIEGQYDHMYVLES